MLEQIFLSLGQVYLGNVVSLLEILHQTCFIEKVILLMKIVQESLFDNLERDDLAFEIYRLFNILVMGWQATLEELDLTKLEEFKHKDFLNVRSSIDSIK